MMTIYTNSKVVIGRIVLGILFIVGIFIIYGIASAEDRNTWVLYLLCILLLSLIFGITFSLFGVIKVYADKSSGELTFVRFFSKNTIQSPEISGYYISVYNTRYGMSYGRIIKTTDNKIIELNPGNLKNVLDIDEYLKEQSVESLGEKRSHYPFTAGL
ncbi:MAG: hypothetical protein NVSMB24_28910 [Mucilaginibacter sp.]